jgi:outer membrane receptor for ferrienterochelin and colicins
MPFQSRLYLTSAVPLITLYCVPFAASAEDPITTLDEVSVISTATRTEQPVEGVTASVIVIDAKQIEKLGAQTLKDVFNNTPGLIMQYGTFPAASSASKSSVSIRGVGATGSLWLLDGRRLSGEVKNPYDMDRIPASMIERIEVVKGPMSALYGADAVGGVINIITKKPKDGFQGDISLRSGANTKGDAEQTQVNGNIRGGKGKVRYSLYGSVQATDPYTEDENTDTKVGSSQHTPSQIPASPGFLNPNGPTGGKPFYLQGDGSVKPKPLDPSKVPTDVQAVQNSFDTFRDSVAGNVKDSYALGVSYREESDVNTVGGRVEFDMTDALTTGLEFNWFEEEREGIYRGDFHPMGFRPPTGHKANPIVGHDENGNPISFFDKFGKFKGKIPSWDVPVRSTDDNERLDLSADAVLNVSDDLVINFNLYNSYYEKRNTTTMTEFADFGYPSEEKSAASGMSANVDITSFETYATWALNDAHLLTIGGELRDEEREATVFSQGPGFDTRSVSYKALYAQDEWDLTDTLNVTLGGRFDEYNQDSYIDSLGNNRDDNKDSEATYRIGMVKNISDMVNLRASFAQGYRVPDIRELFIQKQTPAGLQLGSQAVFPDFNKTEHQLEPEATDSFEVGVSGKKDRLNYEVVVFFNDITNRIQQVSVDANADQKDDYFTFQNVSDAETKGLETTLGYQLTDALDMTFFWTELETENKDNGKQLEFNPERTLSTQFDWAASERLHLGVNAVYTGEQSYVQNGEDKTAADYTLVNVNGSYGFGKDNRFEVFSGIDNLFDESVETRLGSNVGTFVFAGLRAEF